MNDVTRMAFVNDKAAVRGATEVAYQAGVGAGELDEAVRGIDRCLFLLAADSQLADGLADGSDQGFAPEAIRGLADDLERTALRLSAMSLRMSALGERSLRSVTTSS